MRKVKDNKYGYRSWSEEDLKRFGKFLILPLIVVVLVVVILALDWKNRPQPEEPVSAEESKEPETESLTETTEAEEEPDSDFTIGGVPEIEMLVNQYFSAKQNADPESIYQLFGWEDLTGIEELRRQLQYDARYTEGYRNITCYSKPGMAEGSYLVYVSYDLKFKNSLTLAPGILWNYIKTGESGSLYFTDAADLNEVELAYISESEKADEIVLLKTQVYARLRQALEEDPSLAESYSILERQGGSAGSGQGEGIQEGEVLIGQPAQAENGQGAEIQIGEPGAESQEAAGESIQGEEGQGLTPEAEVPEGGAEQNGEVPEDGAVQGGETPEGNLLMPEGNPQEGEAAGGQPGLDGAGQEAGIQIG